MQKHKPRFLALVVAYVALVLTLAPPSYASGGVGKPPPKNSGPSCGSTIYKSSHVAWQCTFADEFNGTALDTSKWSVLTTANSGFVTGPPSSVACYLNSPNNVSESGGYLDLTARKEATTFNCSGITTQYTSGEVISYGKFSQTYGRFEVRAKLPQAVVAGLQEDFWLWPVDSSRYGAEPASGEIDFAELYSQYPNLDVPYIHYVSASADPNVTAYNCTIDPTQFNTFALEWTTTSLTVLYNGQTCLSDVINPAAPLVAPQPFDQPFFLALTQALGIGTNSFDPATTPLPATTLIDYVHVWK